MFVVWNFFLGSERWLPDLASLWLFIILIVNLPAFDIIDLGFLFDKRNKKSAFFLVPWYTQWWFESSLSVFYLLVLVYPPPTFFLFSIFCYCCSITVVPTFPPLLSPALPRPTSHTQFPPTPMWVFYTCSLTWPFPFFPQLSCSPSPLVTVSLSFISRSLVLFCSLVCLVD